MSKNFQSKTFPFLDKNKKFGSILNSITNNVLSEYINLTTIPLGNILEFLQKQDITTVIIEDIIYETDNNWFDINLNDTIEKLHSEGIIVIIVTTKDRITPTQWKVFPTIVLDYDLASPSIEDNQIKIPLLLNEKIFNPDNNAYNNDITYFKYGDISFPEEFVELHSKFKPNIKISTPLALSSVLISRLLDTIKKSKMVYIVDSEDLDLTLLKYIEIAAVLQNTLVFIDSPRIKTSNFSYLVSDYKETTDYIRAFINNKMYLNKILIKKTRQAFINHTFMFVNPTNLFFSQEPRHFHKKNADISVIVATKRKENLDTLLEALNKQVDVKLQVVLLTHGYELNNDEKNKFLKNINFDLIILAESEEISFGNCLNKCLEFVENDYIIKMDDDDFYFPHFIIDIYIGIQYTGAEMVGKNAFFFYLEESNIVGQRRIDFQFKTVKEIKGNTIMCNKSIFMDYKFGDLKRHVDSDLIIRIRENGGRIYSIHPYDMCVYRAEDKTGHTYQVNDSRFLKDAQILYYGKPNKTVTSN